MYQLFLSTLGFNVEGLESYGVEVLGDCGMGFGSVLNLLKHIGPLFGAPT